MINQDSIKSQVYRREWFYEKLLASFNDMESVSGDIKTLAIKLKKKIGETVDYRNSDGAEDYKFVMDYLNEAESEDERITPDSRRAKEDLQHSHVFLIGPATLESLANQKPTNYAYVRESKLPFDNMFFEFLEPLKTKIPFQDNSHSLNAVHLKKNYDSKKPDGYIAYLFYTDEKQMDLEMLTSFDYGSEGNFFCMQGSQSNYLHNMKNLRKEMEGVLQMNCIHLGRTENPTYCLLINANERSVKKVDIMHNPITEKPEEVGSSLPMEEVEKEGFYTQVPNLCVNLVNYINAHNVTIVKRERKVAYLDKRPNGKTKKRTERRPYNLIVLKDMIVERPEGQGEKTWELQERIFVRGYNRRYRITDDDARPRLWIPPHIKGPKNAPFREQRYQVLYEKLGREIQMFRDLGLKHDSEMWIGR
jgi:hypothetical protein